MHVHAEQAVVVDGPLASGTSRPFVRWTIYAITVVAAFMVVSMLLSTHASADEPPPPPVVPVDLLGALQQPVTAVVETVDSLTTPVLEPAAPVVDAVAEPVVAPVVQPLVTTTESLAVPLAEAIDQVTAPLGVAPLVPSHVELIAEAISPLVDLVLPIESATDLAAPSVIELTTLDHEFAAAVPHANAVESAVDASAADDVVTAIAPVVVTIEAATADRSDHPLAPAAPLPVRPATPALPASGPTSGDAPRASGNDVLTGALLAEPATGGTAWWLMATTAFGFRSALVLSRLERPG